MYPSGVPMLPTPLSSSAISTFNNLTASVHHVFCRGPCCSYTCCFKPNPVTSCVTVVTHFTEEETEAQRY
jgi:hypothetical protein